MISSKVKVFVFVSALLLFISFFAVGCKTHAKSSWVNTSTLPGNTFKNNTGSSSSKIVYLGSKSSSSNVNFGPGDVSFDFENLK